MAACSRASIARRYRGPRSRAFMRWTGHTPWKQLRHSSSSPHARSTRALGSADANTSANMVKASPSIPTVSSPRNSVTTASGAVVGAHTESLVGQHRSTTISRQSVHGSHALLFPSEYVPSSHRCTSAPPRHMCPAWHGTHALPAFIVPGRHRMHAPPLPATYPASHVQLDASVHGALHPENGLHSRHAAAPSGVYMSAGQTSWCVRPTQ